MKNDRCEISFYHLSRYPVMKVLPKLLEKTYQSCLKTLVLCNNDSEMSILNDMLWTYASKAFVPHGSIKDQFPEVQPILLTTSSLNINDAEIIVVLTGVIPENIDKFERCLDVFYAGESDDTITQAKSRYNMYNNNGYPLNYWIQADDGSWVNS